MIVKLIFSSLILLSYISLSSPIAHALNCKGRLISVGDSKYQVLSKCGTPTYSSEWRHSTIISTVPGPGPAHSNPSAVVEWIYDFGPNRFIQILTFHDGKLNKIQSGGYGNPVTANSTNKSCNGLIAKRSRIYQVIIKC